MREKSDAKSALLFITKNIPSLVTEGVSNEANCLVRYWFHQFWSFADTEIKTVKVSQLLKQVTFSLRRMPYASGVSQTRN